MAINYELRVQKMREAMAALGVDAFIVPYADQFQSHNGVAEGADRLYWLTGFKGSAGLAVVGANSAALFVDSRYVLSAPAQVERKLFEIIDDSQDITPQIWAKSFAKVGYDPFLHTQAELEPYLAAGVVLEPISLNPVDAAQMQLGEKKEPRLHKAIEHDLAYSGMDMHDKIDLIGAKYKAVVITSPDSVSWLLNLRVLGRQTPVVHGYVLLDGRQVRLYTDVPCPDLGGRVQVLPLAQIEAGLQEGARREPEWHLDMRVTPVAFKHILEKAGAKTVSVQDPVVWPKACKNKVEQEGIKASHIRDGVAVARFLHRVDTGVPLRETEIAQLVLDSRARDKSCFYYSFEPIVGFNENGAFVHGQVPDEQVKLVQGNGLLLIDSGGQYLDGTTDITRTVVVGTPSLEMKRCFTLVLKGHIALARACFPVGTPGVALDVLARQFLWQAGLNYGHGTGHGVGYCLNVHEGPCNISPKAGRAAEPLRAGVLISNEPGYYREGGFGIRHENLYLVVEDTENEGFLRFEPVTLAPFDVRGLLVDMLTADEKAWLNAYHARVRKILFPLLEPQVAAWLTERTAPV